MKKEDLRKILKLSENIDIISVKEKNLKKHLQKNGGNFIKNRKKVKKKGKNF